MSWKKLSAITKFQNRYMRLSEEIFQTESGEKLNYWIVRKEPFCVIIPFDGERLLLVGQYRPQVDFFSWEFSMGHAEQDEPLVAARRELQEETGLIANDLKEIARFYPAPGTMDQEGVVYLTTQWQQGSTNREESEKDMQLKWVTPQELKTLIENETIKDGPTIISFYRFLNHLRIQV